MEVRTTGRKSVPFGNVETLTSKHLAGLDPSLGGVGLGQGDELAVGAEEGPRTGRGAGRAEVTGPKPPARGDGGDLARIEHQPRPRGKCIQRRPQGAGERLDGERPRVQRLVDRKWSNPGADQR